MSENNNQEKLIKTAGVIGLALLAFALVYNLVLGGGTGFGFNLYYGRGFDLSGLLASIFALAVKLLWVVFIVSLVIGLVLVLKKHLLETNNLNICGLLEGGSVCPKCGTKVKDNYKFCPSCQASLKETCSKCGQEVKADWKCCPTCGTEK